MYFGELGAYMAKGVRTDLYKSMLAKSLGWHDLREHQAGLMTVVLARETESLEGAATETAAVMAQVILSLVISITIGFIYCW